MVRRRQKKRKRPTPRVAEKCGVCGSSEVKYKCSNAISKKCPTRLCSLECFKKHKEQCAGGEELSGSGEKECAGIGNGESVGSLDAVSDGRDRVGLSALDPENRARAERLRTSAFQPVLELADELGCRVSDSQFSELASSERIRNALRDTRLRELIRRVDGSSMVVSGSGRREHKEGRESVCCCTR